MLKSKAKVKGKNNLAKQLAALKKQAKKSKLVTVGLPDGSGSYPTGEAILMIGAVHEFGSDDGIIPERSYLRSTVEENKAEFLKFWRGGPAVDILTGEEDPQQSLELLGQLAEGKVKQKIVDLKEPANAASTIAAKGSSNPLVDTGLLSQSIRYQVSKK